MRKLAIACLLLAALLLSPLLLIRSEATLIRIAYWAVDTFTDLRLELKSPVLRPFQGVASAKEIHLYPKDDSGPPFLSVLDFSGDISVGDVYAADLTGAALRARQVTIYVSDRDTTEDPEPKDWIRHLTWLPGKLEVGQLHVVAASEKTSIFALRNVDGERDTEDHFDVTAEAAYENRELLLELELRALREEGSFAGLSLYGAFLAPDKQDKVVLDGELRGTRENFTYEFQLDGHYTNIAHLTQNLPDAMPLAGRLEVRGEMQGDRTGFTLSDAYFLLDNLPDYGIEAAGSLQYTRGGNSAIELVAAGELSSMEVVLDWVDIDPRPLGKAQGNARIHGSLKHPVVEEFILRSESDSGLTVNVSGHLDTNLEQRKDNRVSIDIQAPSLSALEHWTGELPYEPGAFHASANLVGERGNIALENLVVELGDRDTVELRMTGSARRLEPPSDVSPGAVTGLELSTEIFVPDSANLAELLESQAIPGGFSIRGQVQFAGDGQRLDAGAGLVTASSSDIDLRLTPRQAVLKLAEPIPLSSLIADVALEVSDTSALSQFTTQAIPVLGPVSGTAKLRQREGMQFSLDDILLKIDTDSLQLQSRGSIADLFEFTGVQFSTDFSRLPLNSLAALAIDTLSPSTPLGDLEGSFQIRDLDSGWHLPQLAVKSTAVDGPVYVSAAGRVQDLGDRPAAELKMQFHIRDPLLLEDITGLKMNPAQGRLEIRADTGKAVASGSGRIGDTRLSLNADLSYDQDAITHLTLSLDSPRLLMRDLGLQAQVDANTEYNPSDRLGDIEAESGLEKLLRSSPPYPVDLAIAIDSIVGDNTNIRQLHIHTTGVDKRYTLRRFDLMYEDSIAEIRGIIDLNTTPPFLSIAGEAVAVPMRTLGRDLGVNKNVGGHASVRGGLTAQGANRHDLTGSLNGSLAMALENAEIDGAAYDVLATDFLAWIYSGAATEKSTKIDCTMAKFQLTDGVARSDSLYIETEKMVATGSAELDMVRKKMDVQITPRSKSRAIQVPSAIRLKGDFDNPRPIISPITAAADAYAEFLTLAPRIAMKLFGIRIGKKKALRPCET